MDKNNDVSYVAGLIRGTEKAMFASFKEANNSKPEPIEEKLKEQIPIVGQTLLNIFKPRKVLLYSGGMDSWLLSELENPDVKLYVDMNTKYSKEEISRLPQDVKIIKLDLGDWERDDKIIPLRNMFLIGLASYYGEEIYLGATAGDRVLDKSFTFGNKMTDLLTYLYGEQHWTSKRDINVNLESKKLTKTQLLQKYLKNGGDITKAFYSTFSCYNPIDNKECWACKPCFRKFVAFYLNFFDFPDEICITVAKYIEKEIIPQIQSGTYDRTLDEQEDILTVYNNIKAKGLV